MQLLAKGPGTESDGKWQDFSKEYLKNEICRRLLFFHCMLHEKLTSFYLQFGSLLTYFVAIPGPIPRKLTATAP